MRGARAAAALLALACTACAPKIKYEAPAAPTAPEFKENADWKPAQPRDADVRGPWWDVFGDATLASLEQRVDVSNQTLKIAEAQFAQARALVRGARANRFPQVTAAPSASTARSSANRAVATLHDPFTDIVVPLDAAPPGVPVGVPSELLERRADVAAAERRVASAFAQVGVTQAAYYPVLTLSGAVGFESSSFGSLLSSASAFWSAGPAALVNVLDFGRRRAANEQARAAYDVAAAAYRETVLSAFREVEDQLAALRVLEQEATIQDRAVAAAERSLALANNRYRGGVASYLEVITAQSFALGNERAAVNLLTRRMTATVLLLKGLGGNWRAATLPTVASSLE